MQSSCLEFEERRRVEGTMTLSSCSEFKKQKRVEEEGCRTAAYEKKKRDEKLRKHGCRAFA